MELIKFGIRKHPYLTMFIVWLYTFCVLGRFQIEDVVPFSYAWVVIFGAGLIFAERVFLKKREIDDKTVEKDFKRTATIVGVFSAYVLIMLKVFSVVPLMLTINSRNSIVPLCFGIAVLAAGAVYLTVKKKWCSDKVVILILGLSFVLHIFYILYISLQYQCDLGQFFGNGNGHMGYIEYIYNNFMLPQFDPREKWQYYHPPLNHIICAIFLRLQTMFGVDIRVAIYNLQYLPILYFMFTLIIFLKTGKEIGVKKTLAPVLLSVVAFSPAFFDIANYVNNDMISIMFMMLSIYLALKWYKNRTARGIIKIALAFGFGMLSKMSVWMAAVPIAVIFVAALTEELKKKDVKEFRRLFGQMWAFLAVAAPLSLYWSLRNYFRFGVPIGYIPVSDDLEAYIGESSVKRLFDFDFSQFNVSFVAQIKNGYTYNEYNPLIALIKSSSISFNLSSISFDLNEWINRLMLIVTVLLCVISFICMLYILFKRNIISPVFKISIMLFYLTIMISYYIFCLKYPYTCTEDIRYASPVIFVGALFLVLVSGELSKKNKKSNKALNYLFLTISILFCVISVVIMLIYGIDISLIMNFE